VFGRNVLLREAARSVLAMIVCDCTSGFVERWTIILGTSKVAFCRTTVRFDIELCDECHICLRKQYRSKHRSASRRVRDFEEAPQMH
jgi:hypothetical protein